MFAINGNYEYEATAGILQSIPPFLEAKGTLIYFKKPSFLFDDFEFSVYD